MPFYNNGLTDDYFSQHGVGQQGVGQQGEPQEEQPEITTTANAHKIAASFFISKLLFRKNISEITMLIILKKNKKQNFFY